MSCRMKQLCSIVWVQLALAADNHPSWSFVLLEEALTIDGAACLDGSPAGYFIELGSGSGAKKWMIDFLGSGWCLTLQECLERSTFLGSTTMYSNDPDGTEKAKIISDANAFLSNKRSENPDFYNWNKVIALYCDGGSWNSEVAGAVAVGEESIYFRGHRILKATIDTLMITMEQQGGLVSHTDFIVGGCSAGALTVLLHLDYIKRQLPASMQVVGLPQDGMFMDLMTFQNQPLNTPLYKSVFRMIGMANSPSLQQGCVQQHEGETWKCFMAQYVLPFIQTPYFAVNSFYDSWQLSEILKLSNDCKVRGTCMAEEASSRENFRSNMVANCSSSSQGNSHSEFLSTAGFQTLKVSGTSLQSAISNWYFSNTQFQGVDTADMPNGNPTWKKRGPACIGRAVGNGNVGEIWVADD